MGSLTTLTFCLVNKAEETGHGQFHALNMQALNRAAEYIYSTFETPVSLRWGNESLSHINKLGSGH